MPSNRIAFAVNRTTAPVSAMIAGRGPVMPATHWIHGVVSNKEKGPALYQEGTRGRDVRMVHACYKPMNGKKVRAH